MFALTIMFKKISSIFRSMFLFRDNSQNETISQVEKTQQKSDSYVNCLQLRPFDNNLQYKDEFKESKYTLSI